MPVDLGNIVLDEQVISRQLRNDFKDDWFPDPIGFEDYFEGGILSEIIKSNFDANHGQYTPSKALLLNVPKANFTLRYALETSVTDRAIYHALAAELLPLFDPCINWRVFSHRRDTRASVEERRSDTRYTFRNGVAAWSDFLGCVDANLSEDKFLLSTDLANYFENITLGKLSDELIKLVPSLECDAAKKAETRGQIKQLFEYLSDWSYGPEKGLPQNRDASSFLANIYMLPVDNAMIAAGYEYFRYMDDIKIICASEADARKALKTLILALRPLGQSVNSGKTHIVAATDKEKMASCLGSSSPEMKRINSAWQTKSLKPITRSFIPLKNLALETLRQGRYDSREFRFCISRLETLARCVEFNVPKEFFEEITTLVIEGLSKSPVSTDQICRYLRSVDLNEVQVEEIFSHVVDPDKSIYNWKNYRIWVLLAQKSIENVCLRELARKYVAERGDDPSRAGATIYLGKMGALDDRQLIAEKFGELSSYLGQRCGLIGAQEIHFSAGRSGGPCIKTHVGPHLRADLKGVYKTLNRSGRYVSDLEPMLITRYVDLERDYD
ncbi:RNA-directed DNA polymerase [Methylobacterium sp. 391_Methyba4]|uniref:RNA-directed DNA polymerase n=1 Tax=Methylobacterium sp. 391_Methyba4 TaxID=3038924 RepID=UPI00241E6C3D|nr:RNA-directed DNA polymerase [Methylobacterium sp. 391_Methyba4]WFS09212.1 RNA-directed DNA polymerase [Methylobacterium sp. 391_Methyba4]